MSSQVFTSKNKVYLADIKGVEVVLWLKESYGKKLAGYCQLDMRTALPRWCMKIAGIPYAMPTQDAANAEQAVLELIQWLEKFELPVSKGNPLPASTRRLLAAVRNEDRPQRQLTAGRSAGERVRGVCID